MPQNPSTAAVTLNTLESSSSSIYGFSMVKDFWIFQHTFALDQFQFHLCKWDFVNSRIIYKKKGQAEKNKIKYGKIKGKQITCRKAINN